MLLLWLILICATLYLIQFCWKIWNLLIYSKEFKSSNISCFDYLSFDKELLNKIIKDSQSNSPCKCWLGPMLIINICNPENIEIVLNKELNKNIIYKHTSFFFKDNLVVTPADIWRFRKKLILPSFNKTNLISYASVFNNKSEKLTNILQTFIDDKIVAPISRINNASIAALYESLFDIDTEYSETDNNFEENKIISQTIHFMWNHHLHFFYYIDYYLFKKWKYYQQYNYIKLAWENLTKKIIKQRRINYNIIKNNIISNGFLKKQSFVDTYIEKKLPLETLRNDILIFMLAGTHTTTSTIGFVLEMLGMHQTIQERVYEEIVNEIGLEKPLEYSDIPKLPYLNRVIKETMRLFPAGSIIVRSIEENLVLHDGKILPKGSTAVICIIALHRWEKYYPNPLNFDPDRFLPEACKNRLPYSYLPYSGGPRNCIAYQYANVMLPIFIANIVKKLKVHTTYKKVEDIGLRMEVTLAPVEGYKFFFENRN